MTINDLRNKIVELRKGHHEITTDEYLTDVEFLLGIVDSLRATDSIVEKNRQMLLERSRAGIDKYGTALDKNPLSLHEWLTHALEESLDLCNYLQAARVEIQKTLNSEKGDK